MPGVSHTQGNQQIKSVFYLCTVTQATLGDLVSAVQRFVEGGTSKKSAQNDQADDDVQDNTCAFETFSCMDCDWQLLFLQKGRARHLTGSATLELRRGFELWPNAEVVLERVPVRETSGDVAPNVPALTTILGSSITTTSAGYLTKKPDTEMQAATETPRSVAEAFEASQNYLKVHFNDPFCEGASSSSDPDFQNVVSIDGRDPIAVLRRKIAAQLLLIHPEQQPLLDELEDAEMSDVRDAETKEESGTSNIDRAADALAIHLRTSQRASMIKNETKPVSTLGSNKSSDVTCCFEYFLPAG